MSTIQVGPIEIGYDDASSGPPVVFLHGFPFNRSMWLEQFGALVQEYRVVALDLRGLRQTTATTEPATMEAMAGDVVAVLDALSISRAVICGLSMGGYVALALCRAFPLRVRALVLADTRATPDADEVRLVREQQAQQALATGMASITETML